MTPAALVPSRVVEVPSLQPVLAEHLDDYDGDLLPYLFIADVQRWMVPRVRNNPLTVGRVLTWLEQEFLRGDDAVKDWIAVGLLEVLPRPGEPGDKLVGMLGPALAATYRQLWGDEWSRR